MALVVLILIVVLIKFLRTNKKLKKYSQIINIENETEKLNKKFEKLIKKYRTDKEYYNIKNYEEHIGELQTNLHNLENEHFIKTSGSYLGDEYDFEEAIEFKNALKELRQKEKEMVKAGRAVTFGDKSLRDLEIYDGKKLLKDLSKLILRAFNGECDSYFSQVKWNNIKKFEEKINKSFETINTLGNTVGCRITKWYLNAKLKELYLINEYQIKKQEEIEEQRAIREQMREEAKMLKEIEKAQKEAEIKEKTQLKALEEAKKQLANKHGEELNELEKQIALLEERLKEAQENKERALSQAQLTKQGHVYIISNIGSFGENIYKIGMTRRLEPMDRVKELGDASVPFSFDVHAMIHSKDAPKLEKELHKIFEDHRVNKINNRKEFFKVSLNAIEEAVKNHHGEFKLTKLAEAREYRQSLEVVPV